MGLKPFFGLTQNGSKTDWLGMKSYPELAKEKNPFFMMRKNEDTNFKVTAKKIKEEIIKKEGGFFPTHSGVGMIGFDPS